MAEGRTGGTVPGMWFRRKRFEQPSVELVDPFTETETAAIVAHEEARLIPLAIAASLIVNRDRHCDLTAQLPAATLTFRNRAGQVVIGVDDTKMVEQVAAMARLEQFQVEARSVNAQLWVSVTSPSWRYAFWALPIAAHAH